MAVIDTNILIENVKKDLVVQENLTEVSIAEYPPAVNYKKLEGNILIIKREDILFSIELQRELRNTGKPKSFADLLIAAICINRKEKLLTKDKDFLDIAEISDLEIELKKQF